MEVSWFQEPRPGSWGAAAPASVYLFIILIRVRTAADGWVGFFMQALTV